MLLHIKLFISLVSVLCALQAVAGAFESTAVFSFQGNTCSGTPHSILPLDGFPQRLLLEISEITVTAIAY